MGEDQADLEKSRLISEKTAGISGATIVTYAVQGKFVSNIYSKGTFENYGTVNLVNIQMSFLEYSNGITFLYMMQ